MSGELEFESALANRPVPRFVGSDRSRSVTWKHWRRHIVGRARRIARWEFWPAWAFYPPVIAYVLYLGVKHRSFTLFTAANPSIPDGGFVGESKYAILQELEPSYALPKTMLLPAGSIEDRCASLEHFMYAHRLNFPIVLKPDTGQRGSGVEIVHSAEQARDYLHGSPIPVIAQEYVAGVEFGIFYYRIPGELRGRIFSITEKRMPVVIGDGKRTVEELILADERAVCMAAFYLRKNAHQVSRVPHRGERVQLVDIGTHCRGAIFLDGSGSITPALEDAIDRIARHFEGFYFGRFDIRAASFQDLMAGRNLKVLELNGVTSEATHIYDPRISLLAAYRTLLRQWRLAFEIGGRNCERGVRPSSVRRLFRAVQDYRRLARQHSEQ